MTQAVNLRRALLLITAAVLLVLRASPQAGQQAASSPGVEVLLLKAKNLQVRGRLDLASEVWQQVLLADAGSVEALTGLAHVAAVDGHAPEAALLLTRLHSMHAAAATLARAETGVAQALSLAALQHAAELARSGSPEAAMRIFRQVFGPEPPEGEWTVLFYETEASTPAGHTHALAQLRRLASREPEVEPYGIALGRLLTYDRATRDEGRTILKRYPADPGATGALDTARLREMQDAANPVMLAERQRRAAEAAAYRMLHEGNLADAERLFEDQLRQEPERASTMAGLGYVRMAQSRFAVAIALFRSAERIGGPVLATQHAAESARHSLLLATAQQARRAGDLPTAEERLNQAMLTRPADPDALLALGDVLMAEHRPAAAVPVFAQFTVIRPADPQGWRDLFAAHLQARDPARALETYGHAPSQVLTILLNQPEFLGSLASAQAQTGHAMEACHTLRQARALPALTHVPPLQLALALQYANLLLQTEQLPEAETVFSWAVTKDPDSSPAWAGLLYTQHRKDDNDAAHGTLSSLPVAIRAKLLAEPGFVEVAAAIEQRRGDLNAAEALLTDAVARNEREPGVAHIQQTKLQLAGILLLKDETARAVLLYREVALSTGNVDAWTGLLAALHRTGQDQAAAIELHTIPDRVRRRMEGSRAFLEAEFRVERATGKHTEAAAIFRKMEASCARESTVVPAELAIEYAWTLYDSGEDGDVAARLRELGNRAHLTEKEHATVDALLANLAVRRAGAAAAHGKFSESVAILDGAAASLAPSSPAQRTLASGYLAAGQPRRSLKILGQSPSTTATAAECKTALAAALTAHDAEAAQRWLRAALDLYPMDSGLLHLAAEEAQAESKDRRAVAYLRASLAAAAQAQEKARSAAAAGEGEGSTTITTDRSPSHPAQSSFGGERSLLQNEIARLSGRYSAWSDMSSTVQTRSGQPGLDRLVAIELPLQSSWTAQEQVRFGLTTRAVFLTNGSVASEKHSSTGTGAFARSQSVSGMGAELWAATRNTEFSVGYTPNTFPVSRILAHIAYRPSAGHVTFLAGRDAVRETELSYAGLRSSTSPALAPNAIAQGTVWGGVSSTGGGLALSAGTRREGVYANAEADVLTGRHVLRNSRLQESAGVYRRLQTRLLPGDLTAAASLFGMHDTHNENALSFGNGGYFSPQMYLLGSLSLRYEGEAGSRLRFALTGAPGVQRTRERTAMLFPLDPSLQAAATASCTSAQLATHTCAAAESPAASSTGVNFNVSGQTAFQLADQWTIRASFLANNTNGYTLVRSGFSLRYFFRRQIQPENSTSDQIAEDSDRGLRLP